MRVSALTPSGYTRRMHLNPDQQIKALQDRMDAEATRYKEKRKKLRTMIADINAGVSAQKRRDETRRKILIGVAALAEMKTHHEMEGVIYGWLDKHLKRPDERAVFDFAPLPDGLSSSEPPPSLLVDVDES